ncbi:MAG: hypothetical protein K2O60_06490 [Ruminococcus sp.]|nr:hypothetical protein [Ruminococcus sp.]
MYDISAEYIQAIESKKLQHIKGRIRTKYGKDIELNDKNLVGEVSYSRQCTSDESAFGIGQLYTGTAQITIKSGNIDRENLRGGSLYLEWCVHEHSWIPLGKWKITNPTRTSENLISITAQDCIGDLDVPINDNYVGAITLEARLEKVKQLTGVEFAQTAEEIKELIGDTGVIFGTTFCSTCRAEVAAIAGYMGGIAFADRYGRIKFRKFGTAPVLTIPADLRHKISVSEYNFGVRGVGYRDKYGYTAVHEIEGGNVNTACVPVLSENPYIFDTSDADRAEIQYRDFLQYSAQNLQILDWTPGEIEYYGNPALELGDFVEISGGINGEKSTNFLITAEHWQFRGPHTLISAGASENTVTDGGNSGISANQQMFTTINTTKNICAVDLESTGETSGIVASGQFSVREETTVFADITLNLRGMSDSEIEVNLFFDDIEQPSFFIGKIKKNEPLTVHLSSHKTVAGGIHKAEVKLSENCEILGNSSYLWGQNIASALIFSSIEELEKYPIEVLEKFKISQLEGQP